MKIFEDYLHVILDHEGGYVNHKNDPGGVTKFGICQKSYPNLDIKNLTTDQASEIYHIDYWLPMKLDLIEGNELLKLHLFDMGVNSGIRNAIKLLQAIVETTPDGIMGKTTAYSVAKYGKSIVNDYITARKHYYTRLIEMNPKLKDFEKGWMNRVDNTKF